ncbi:MAG: hypothetical protein AB1424_08875 [Thermodesulfobacteriota bacterium]
MNYGWHVKIEDQVFYGIPFTITLLEAGILEGGRKKKGKEKKESHERSCSSLQTGIGLRGLILRQNRGFPLMAAGVPVLVMPIVVGVLMGMSLGLVAVLMAVVAMGLRLMRVLMLMLVLVVAAHCSSLLSLLIIIKFIHLPRFLSSSRFLVFPE